MELVRPDIDLITGFSHTSVVKNGYFTTYDFSRDNVAVAPLGVATSRLPTVGSLDWSITTGKQGEVTGSSLTIATKRSETVITVTVLSYNRPASIAAPPAGQVTREDSKYLRKLLGSTPIASLLVPKNMTSRGSTQLN